MPHWTQRKRDEAIEYANSQQAVTRCALCRWKYRGKIGTGKKLFRKHLEHKHSSA